MTLQFLFGVWVGVALVYLGSVARRERERLKGVRYYKVDDWVYVFLTWRYRGTGGKIDVLRYGSKPGTYVEIEGVGKFVIDEDERLKRMNWWVKPFGVCRAMHYELKALRRKLEAEEVTR